MRAVYFLTMYGCGDGEDRLAGALTPDPGRFHAEFVADRAGTERC